MSLLKNSTIVVIGIIISNILAYIFHIYVGRSLGPAEYGVFGALLALLTLLAMPAGAINSSVTKFTARFNADKEKGKIATLRKKMLKAVIIYSIIVIAILIIFSKYIADYLQIPSLISVILIGILLFFSVLLYSNRGFLQGLKKFKSYSWNTIIESVSRLILVVIILFMGFKVNGALLAYGLGYFIAFLFVFISIRETGIKNNKEKINKKQVYNYIILVFIINLVIQSIINLPTIFIKHFLSSEFTGYWTAALTLARVSLYIASGIVIVMFAEVAGQKEKARQRSIFKKTLILTLLASICISIIFWVAGSLAIRILYGTDFLAAVPILQWLGVAMIAISILQLSLNYWLAGRGE